MNLFPNPSVETSLDGFSFFIGGGTSERSTEWAQDGDYSIKVVADDGVWQTDGVSATVDTAYVFSVYAKGSGAFRLGWRAKDILDVQLDSTVYTTSFTLTDEPQQCSISFTPTNPATHTVIFQGYGIGGPSRTWYTDWHQLEEGSVATPYPSGAPYARIRSQFELRPY
jgi:hypothetical protein